MTTVEEANTQGRVRMVMLFILMSFSAYPYCPIEWKNSPKRTRAVWGEQGLRSTGGMGRGAKERDCRPLEIQKIF